jgi:hypothetical protein
MLILNIQQVEAGFIVGNIRAILWLIAKGCLMLLDGMFSVINEIWRFQFFNNEYVNTLFMGAIVLASSWLCLKIMIEFVLNYIVIKSENNQSPLLIFKGVIIAIVVMFAISPLFDMGHKFSVGLTESVITVTGMNKDQGSLENSMSRAILTSMSNKNSMDNEDLEYFLDNWKTEDINKTTGGFIGFGKVYSYDFNFFMMIVISILILFLLMFVGIQMAKRVVELALYKIISPMVATSLTNNRSKAFDTWLKGLISLLLVTSVQFICLGLLVNSFSSIMAESNNILAGLFFLVGALLFVITSPQIISSLLGENIGAMSAYSDIQSTVLMASGIGMGLSAAKAGVTGAMAKGASVSSIIPKAGGAISGMSEQFRQLKNSGSSTLGAVAKVGANQIGSPIKNTVDSKFASFQNMYRSSRESSLSKSINQVRNPIKFAERNDRK